MNDTTKGIKLDQGSEERGSDSLEPDKDQDAKRPVTLISGTTAKRDLKGRKSKNAGLSEKFFLPDISEG